MASMQQTASGSSQEDADWHRKASTWMAELSGWHEQEAVGIENELDKLRAKAEAESSDSSLL